MLMKVLEGGSTTLSACGELVIRVLQNIGDMVDSARTEDLTDVAVGLYSILKLVPSNDRICSTLSAFAKRTPKLASSVTPDVVSALLRSGAQSALGLAMCLAAESGRCFQMMTDWFAAHKTWRHGDRLSYYVDTVLFMLKTCIKGLICTSFLTSCIVCRQPAADHPQGCLPAAVSYK